VRDDSFKLVGSREGKKLSMRLRLHASMLQVICLHANLYFPEVTLQTETLWFGSVVCPDCVQTMDFSISNTSFVPLEWRIVTEDSHLNMVDCAKLDGFVDWVNSVIIYFPFTNNHSKSLILCTFYGFRHWCIIFISLHHYLWKERCSQNFGILKSIHLLSVILNFMSAHNNVVTLITIICVYGYWILPTVVTN
jgi:hypothetical protein